MYQVVQAPKDGGAVYSTAPVDDLGKVTTVHRSLLKSRVQRDPHVGVVVEKVVELPEVSMHEEDELDLEGVIPAPDLVVSNVDLEMPCSLVQTDLGGVMPAQELVVPMLLLKCHVY